MSATKRVLVTGATGFVGRQLLVPLLRRGYEVHAVSRRAVADLPAEVVLHAADLLDCAGHRQLLEHIRPSHLLHSAWYVEHGKYWDAPENDLWLKATVSLVESFCLAGGSRAVGVGTCAEYDWKYGTLVEGQTPEQPASLYGSAKLAAGRNAAAVAAAHAVGFAWARIFFPFGPGEPENRLIPHVITRLLRGEPARCTHGRQVRDFLYVADVGDALAALLDSGVQGPINIGSGVPATIGDVAARIGAALERPELIMLGAVTEAEGSPGTILASNVRLAQEVGWTPRHSLNEGLQLTIDWWRESVAPRTMDGTLTT
jgi:nucleoside-diphosphate-sugar epimerase